MCFKSIHLAAFCMRLITTTCLMILNRSKDSDLLLCLDVELVATHQLKHLLGPKGQKLLRHRHLYKVLVNEAVGCIVKSCTHHSLCKLPHTEAILGMQPVNQEQINEFSVYTVELI